MAESGNGATPARRKALQTARLRLARHPLLGALSAGLLQDVAARLEPQALRATAQRLVNRRTSIEAETLNVVRGVQRATATGLEREVRVLDGERQVHEQVRTALLDTARQRTARTRAGRKGDATVTGQVLDPRTGKGVPGMVVELVGAGAGVAEPLAVDVTDEDGRYAVVVPARVLKERGGPVEATVRFGLARRLPLGGADTPVTLQPDAREERVLNLPEKAAASVESRIADRATLDRMRVRRLNGVALLREAQHDALREVTTDLLGALDSVAKRLEARLARAAPAGGSAAEEPERPADDSTSEDSAAEPGPAPAPTGEDEDG